MLVWYQWEHCGFSQTARERRRLREEGLKSARSPHQDRLSDRLPGRYSAFLRLGNEIDVHLGPTFGFVGHDSATLESDPAIAILMAETMDRTP